VRHLKIGILHPSNSLPVTFYALFSGDKYREIDDKYRETRHMNWVRYHLSVDMDIGKNMAPHSTGIDGFYSSPRSWILEQGAPFANSRIGGHNFRNSHL